MGLKFKIDSLEGLDESIAGMYEKDGDSYKLKVEGIPQGEDVNGLKSKVDELLAEKKEAARKAKEAEEAARKAEEEAARKNGDTEALEKSWQDKLSKREQELQAEIDEMNGSVTTMTVDNVAVKLANEIAVQGSADILIPHIKSRLAAERKDGQYVTVVRDADGKPSAATLDDLKNEFANNKAFAPVVVGSKASGGGAGGGNGGGGGAATGNMGGSKQERQKAIAAKYPDLQQ